MSDRSSLEQRSSLIKEDTPDDGEFVITSGVGAKERGVGET